MIGSWPSIERIVAIPTIKEIIALTAIENIIVPFTVEGIVSPSTVETVVPSSTVDLVISIIAGDPVSTVLTVNIVTIATYVPEATFTINVIVPISPKDAVRFIFCPRNKWVARSWSTVSEDPVITGISIDLVTSSAALKDVCTRFSIQRSSSFTRSIIFVRTYYDIRKSPEDQREHNRDERKKHPKIAASCSHHRSLLS
jgi:hypothetical protein